MKRSEGAAEQGCACNKARCWIACGEDRIEDSGEVDAVEWRGGRSDDNGRGVRKAVANGLGVERAVALRFV